MSKLGIWAIAIATAFVVGVISANSIGNAAAQVDLDTIDLKILDIQIKEFETGYKQTSDLVKIELNFQNNGDAFYTLKKPTKELLLLLALPNLSAEELIEDSGKNIIDNFVYVASQSFGIQYKEVAAIGSDCEKPNFSLRSGESKRITICYEIPLSGVPKTTDRIGRDQFYLRLITSPGSSCPNCKMISLSDIAESTEEKIIPKVKLPGTGTFNILVHEMPKQWESDYGTILDDALEFWKQIDPELEFNQVNYWKDADFSIAWASTYGGKFGEGPLGYYSPCCDDYGLPFVVITLGYFDESNNWIRTDIDYSKEILKHEIGHALDYEHTDDPDDIMFPFAFHEYEKWKELGSKTKEFIPTTEQRTEIPAWIRSTAAWWGQNEISDNDFVNAMQFLINADIIQIPKSTDSDLTKGRIRSDTEHGYLEIDSSEYFISKSKPSITSEGGEIQGRIWYWGEYYDIEGQRSYGSIDLLYPTGKTEKVELWIDDFGEFANYMDVSPYGDFEGIYQLKVSKQGKDIGSLKFTVKSGEPDKEVMEQEIPSWIKNNADWWSQGLITDNDFVKGIQYLVEQGIIKV